MVRQCQDLAAVSEREDRERRNWRWTDVSLKAGLQQLNRELKEVKRHREVTREQRSKSYVPVVAIVGYTNAGKSTLLKPVNGSGYSGGR